MSCRGKTQAEGKRVNYCKGKELKKIGFIVHTMKHVVCSKTIGELSLLRRKLKKEKVSYDYHVTSGVVT